MANTINICTYIGTREKILAIGINIVSTFFINYISNLRNKCMLQKVKTLISECTMRFDILKYTFTTHINYFKFQIKFEFS